jgi:type IV pilus assembly protein PilX
MIAMTPRPAMRSGRAVPREQGVALFIALVVLLIITILGISGLQTTTLEERMAAGARDRDLAFQAAEAALTQGEAFVETLGPADMNQFTANTNGLYVPPTDPDDPPRWEEVDWENDTGIPTVGVSIDGLASQPKYIIEHMTTLQAEDDALNISNLGTPIGAPTEIFRVTAYAQGGTARAVVMLQATYGKIL